MNIETFFREHGLNGNPFAAEEARHDEVFERLMASSTRHPDFAKILGRIEDPSTAVVFGEKGSGKTAIRLTIASHVHAHNRQQPVRRTLVVAYDDLNPVLDRVMQRLGRGKVHAESDPAAMQRLLEQVRLADHQDAILSLAVTRLVDAVLDQPGLEEDGAHLDLGPGGQKTLRRLPRQVRADLAVLGALYDRPRGGSAADRFTQLCRRLRLSGPLSGRFLGPLAGFFGLLGLGLLAAAVWIVQPPFWAPLGGSIAVALGLLMGGLWVSRQLRCWNLDRKIHRELRTMDRRPGDLVRMLRQLSRSDLTGQSWPLPGNEDSRYQLTARLLTVLRPLGYGGLMVLVDRVDEPTAIHGHPQRMKAVIWPMLDNKFLQQPDVGVKMLLPLELRHLLARESADFFQEARLDKQNMVDRLSWSGVTLLDLCNQRLAVCASDGEAVDKPASPPLTLTSLFEADVSRELLIETLDQMHQPRDAFKFLYAVIQEHCRNVADDQPHYRIPRLVLESVRREHARRLDDFARGFAPG